jgi:hypothetical protein
MSFKFRDSIAPRLEAIAVGFILGYRRKPKNKAHGDGFEPWGN